MTLEAGGAGAAASPVLSGLRVWDDRQGRSAAANMALDEALTTLERQPVLRVYRWACEAVTCGYFCRYSEVSEMLGGRDHARRWTGGGVVEHGSDVTLALVVPRAGAWRRMSAGSFYCWLHQRIGASLDGAAGGLRMVSDAEGSRNPGGACFSNPVASDIVSKSGKVAGGAIRRTHDAILYQGSLQGVAAGTFSLERLVRALVTGVGAGDEPCAGHDAAHFAPPASLLELASRLERDKYATDAWTMGRR